MSTLVVDLKKMGNFMLQKDAKKFDHEWLFFVW